MVLGCDRRYEAEYHCQDHYDTDDSRDPTLFFTIEHGNPLSKNHEVNHDYNSCIYNNICYSYTYWTWCICLF